MHTLARMLWLHRRIRATTVYAACTARVELAAFDYAYTHTRLRRYYARGRRVARSSRESHRVAFVELAVLETGNSPFNERVSITRFSIGVSVFLETSLSSIERPEIERVLREK